MEHPLRRWRKEKRLSLDALADKVGVSKSTLSRVETGTTPSVGLIRRLCEEADGALKADDFIEIRRAG